MSVSPGYVLSGRYTLVRSIAVGGMGQVWEADDTVLDRHVAIKILRPEFSSDPEFVERFRAEATTTARISHPGVAAVYDYGQIHDPNTGQPLSYLVMELVRGEPLSDVLSREGRVPQGHTLDMLEQTARALQAAHAIGLVHRDVKPGNILITPAGQVKLTDFGIAKSMGAAPVTQTGMVVGTAQYIAPEQAMGRETTPAGDVYSLGVVGYECLAGRRPFVADSPVTVAMMHVRDVPPPLPDALPAGVRELVRYTLAKEPELRYANGAEFADAIADVRAGRPPRPPVGLASRGGTSRQPVSPATRTMTQLQRPVAPTTGRRDRVAAPSRVAPAPAARRRGCGVGTLVALLVALILLLTALVAVSRSGLFDGSDPTSTPSPTPSTSRAPEPTPTPEEPSPTPTQRPTPSRPTAPTTNPLGDLGGILDSFTSQLNQGGLNPSGIAPPNQYGGVPTGKPDKTKHNQNGGG